MVMAGFELGARGAAEEDMVMAGFEVGATGAAEDRSSAATPVAACKMSPAAVATPVAAAKGPDQGKLPSAGRARRTARYPFAESLAEAFKRRLTGDVGAELVIPYSDGLGLLKEVEGFRAAMARDGFSVSDDSKAAMTKRGPDMTSRRSVNKQLTNYKVERDFAVPSTPTHARYTFRFKSAPPADWFLTPEGIDVWLHDFLIPAFTQK